MDISIQPKTANFNFQGRRPTYAKEVLDKKFRSLLEKKDITKEQFYEKVDVPFYIVSKWFKDTFGVPIGRFFKNKKNEKLKEELMQCRLSGMSNAEIGKKYSHDRGWVSQKINELGVITKREAFYKKLDENIPKMLEAGYTVKVIAEKLNVSDATVWNWIRINKEGGLVQFRHNHNIKLNYDYDKSYLKLKKEVTDFFASGGTISEAKKKFNTSASTIYYWINRFNIKTRKQKAQEYMQRRVPELIKQKLSLKEMAAQTGVSDATILRYIKKITGKNYSDIKKGISD